MCRHRQTGQSGAAHRHSARRSQLQDLRRRGEERRHRILRDAHARRPRRDQLRLPHAGRRGWRHLPLEPALVADDVEGGASAGLRQHGGRQTLRRNAADRRAAGRGDERGRHSEGRVQRRARLRPRFGRRIPDHASAGQRHHLHRRNPHRRSHHEGCGQGCPPGEPGDGPSKARCARSLPTAARSALAPNVSTSSGRCSSGLSPR
jgi:hypothetical protein